MLVKKSNTFKRSGFVSWMYKFTTGNIDLPKGLCELSWMVAIGLLFSTIVSPLLTISLLFKRFRRKPEDFRLIYMILVMLGLTIISLLIIIIITKTIEYGLLLVLLEGLKFIGAVVCIIAISLLIGYCIVRVTEYLKDKGVIKKLSEEEKEKIFYERELKRANKKTPKWIQLISDGFRAFMDKNCPKVEWID